MHLSSPSSLRGPDDSPRHVRIAIIGSGFAGLGAAIRLRQAGFEDFLVLERANEVGGVWRDNSYPGCACDVESHLYSFSFAPNPSWSRAFSPRAEIFAYLRRCAAEFGIVPKIRFGHEVREATWNDDGAYWRIETSQGTYTADVLIAGMGAMNEPSTPDLPGLESFEGKVFHSSRWDHGHDLTGRDVAVVGTGASAIQFVPAIQPKVGKLRLFQRTPAWVMPRPDRAMTTREQSMFRAAPALQRLMRAAIYAKRELFLLAFTNANVARAAERQALRYLKQCVSDPVLRKKLTPDFRFGCKRILISNEYLQSLTQPNVDVITDGIREVRARSIVTADGEEHPADTIIFGTGFRITDMPFADRVRGRDGRTLNETWEGSPKAHLGTTVNGFPNMFLLLGPNSGLGHTSVVLMIEAQIELALGALRHMQKHDIETAEPLPETQAKFIADIDRGTEGSVWTSGGCVSWYIDKTGRNSTLWPGHSFSFTRRCRFRAKEYALTPRRLPALVEPPRLGPAVLPTAPALYAGLAPAPAPAAGSVCDQ